MSRNDPFMDPELAGAFQPSMSRRAFVRSATVGTVVIALGGAGYCLASEEEEKKARATKRPDGRPRLPPSQYLLEPHPSDGRDRRRSEPGRVAAPGVAARSSSRSRSTSPSSSRCRRSIRRATCTA